MEFKKNWGTMVRDITALFFYYNKTTKLMENDNNFKHKTAKIVSQFIPVSCYERFGDFCYKHLG